MRALWRFISPIMLTACGSTGAALRPGQVVPNITLQDETGAVRTLTEFQNHIVVVYFYPRDATPGCTREACEFRDAWTRYSERNIVVLGVSTDDVESHRNFKREHDLPFPLLADVHGEVARSFGVPVRLGMAMRHTFIIDRQGRLVRQIANVDPAVHADEILRIVQGMN